MGEVAAVDVKVVSAPPLMFMLPLAVYDWLPDVENVVPSKLMVVGLEPELGIVTLLSGVGTPILSLKVTTPVPGAILSAWPPEIFSIMTFELPALVLSVKFEPAPKTIVPVANDKGDAAAVVVNVVVAPPDMLKLPDVV